MLDLGKSLPILVRVDCIWDQSTHAGLTDLIEWKGSLYCIFRESDSHWGGKNGILQLLSSKNRIVWSLIQTIEVEGWDLRDPKLFIVPDGRLGLIAGASQYTHDKKRLKHVSLTSFSKDGVHWDPFVCTMKEEWLWRLTWHKGTGWGFSYYFTNPDIREGEWGVRLYKTQDALQFEKVTDFSIPGKPNEATLRFLPSDQMVVLLRREEKGDNHAWIGTSFPPYEDWIWNETHTHFGGPNFLVLPHQRLKAVGRILQNTPYGQIEKTVVGSMDLHDIYPELLLPSSGDCGYPGLVFEDPFLWISYYSSHHAKSSIFLAKVRIES